MHEIFTLQSEKPQFKTKNGRTEPGSPGIPEDFMRTLIPGGKFPEISRFTKIIFLYMKI
jgi:hypothetical protein